MSKTLLHIPIDIDINGILEYDEFFSYIDKSLINDPTTLTGHLVMER